MKILTIKARRILEMSLLSFQHASRAELNQESSVKVSEKKQMIKSKSQDKIKIVLNVPITYKYIIQVIEEHIHNSVVLSKTAITNNYGLLISQTKDISRLEWFEKENAWPIKNGLYYVKGGRRVAVGFFDKDKRTFFVQKDLDIMYWSPSSVTLL